MRPRISPLVLILLLAACFAIGLFSRLRQPAISEVPPPSNLPSPTASPPGQTTVLILGVDSLQGSERRLLAIWLASFRLPGRDIFLLGIPTDFPVDAAGAAPLASLFRFDDTGPTSDFLQMLATVAPLPPQLTLVLDRTGFAALIDYLGGLALDGAHLDGAVVLSVLDLLSDDPEASLAMQARVLEALAVQAPQVGTTPDLTSLLALVPEHAYLSSPVGEAAGILAPLLPIEPSTLHFDLLRGPADD